MQCSLQLTQLRGALIGAPVLAYPEAQQAFTVDTDASNMGLGAVLSPRKGDREQVVSYYSRALNRAERNYCMTRWELPMVQALQHVTPRSWFPCTLTAVLPKP